MMTWESPTNASKRQIGSKDVIIDSDELFNTFGD